MEVADGDVSLFIFTSIVFHTVSENRPVDERR